MKRLACACICLCLVSCATSTPTAVPASLSPPTKTHPPAAAITPTMVEPAPAPTHTPAPTATQDLLSTMVASGPMIEVTFDGVECTVKGPSQVALGALVVRFENLSEYTISTWVDRRYPAKTWQDVLDFIGEPGAYDVDIPGWISMLFYTREIKESPTISYRQYELPLAAEYDIVIETSTDRLWPCGYFTATAAP